MIPGMSMGQGSSASSSSKSGIGDISFSSGVHFAPEGGVNSTMIAALAAAALLVLVLLLKR